MGKIEAAKKRGVEEAEGEEDEGVVAGQRAHGLGRVRGHLDGAHAMHVRAWPRRPR